MKIIDATDAILGRMASVVARHLLMGEEVAIVNAEETVISGGKEDILEKFKERRARKSLVNPARHGPFYPRLPEGIVRRAVRGMLPYRKARGREAYKRLKVYRGVPEELKDVESWAKIDIPRASKLRVPKYTKLKRLSKLLGADLR
ncbi:MAG: 50S ribosomal protein L13 [Candidatus Hydrothermarchaeaceae archaeon]